MQIQIRQSSLLLPFPEARSYYDSTSAIELWLSVPRLLGVWLLDIATDIVKSKIQRYVNEFLQNYLLTSLGVPNPISGGLHNNSKSVETK